MSETHKVQAAIIIFEPQYGGCVKSGASNTRPAGHMRPARIFCGSFARPAMLFGKFQMINISLPSVLKKDAAK